MMLVLKEPVFKVCPADVRDQEQKRADSMEGRCSGSRVRQANNGQLGPENRVELLAILEKHNIMGLFPLNPKVLPMARREVTLSLINEDFNLIVCK